MEIAIPGIGNLSFRAVRATGRALVVREDSRKGVASFVLETRAGDRKGTLCIAAASRRAKKRKMYVKIDANRRCRSSGNGTVGRALFQKQPGYTLIEVIVAMGLLLIVVIALCGAFSFGFSSVKLSQEDLRASQILLQKLETLRVYDWSKITNGYIPTNFPAFYSTNGGAVYQGTIAIDPAPVSESYSNTLRQVTVSLSWVSTGVPRHRVVTTLVSQNGIQTYKP
jgi:prepilin-type N-terminal cleavage/methylation domain-containing protein